MSKRVVLIEDHTLVRHVLTCVLVDRLGCALVATCGTKAEGLAACRRERPDLVVLDWMLPDGSGCELVREIGGELAGTRWLALSAHENAPTVRRAVECGVHGFVMKQSSLECFEDALRRLLAGERYFCPNASRLLAGSLRADGGVESELTARERQILALYATGENPKAIAASLGVSPKTVQNQLTRLRDKLGLYEPAQLVRYAIDRGIV